MKYEHKKNEQLIMNCRVRDIAANNTSLMRLYVMMYDRFGFECVYILILLRSFYQYVFSNKKNAAPCKL